MRSPSAIRILESRPGREPSRGPSREPSREDRVDDELIRWCALATSAACSRMTAQHLKVLQDSVGQTRCLPAVLLNQAVGAIHDLIVTVGPVADGIIPGSRRRLLDLIRAGDADGAAAEMEQHLRRLHFMWRLSRRSEPGGIAV